MSKHLRTNKNTFIILFLLTIWLMFSCFIIIDPIIKINNINEYYTYTKTGCNIKKLYEFTQNCPDNIKPIYYNYFQNLLNNKPVEITSREISYIDNLLNITFIKIYNWIPLIVISSLWIFISLTILFIYLKSRDKTIILYTN